MIDVTHLAIITLLQAMSNRICPFLNISIHTYIYIYRTSRDVFSIFSMRLTSTEGARRELSNSTNATVWGDDTIHAMSNMKNTIDG